MEEIAVESVNNAEKITYNGKQYYKFTFGKFKHFPRLVEVYRVDLIKKYSGKVRPEDMLGICMKEGVVFGKQYSFGCADEAIGDNGRAYGAFQILKSNNKIKDSQNFEKALAWTRDRMLRLGYDANSITARKKAIAAHNGSHYLAAYTGYVWGYVQNFLTLKLF